MNPRCGATRPLRRERCARSSLPCVASANRRIQPNPPARGEGDRSVKPALQKRLRDGSTVAEIAKAVHLGQGRDYSAD